jgi:hypothetical protein
MGHVEEKEFNREELLAELNDKAHKRTGMSFEELVRLDRAGKLEDRGAVADLLMFVDLFSKADPILQRA